MRERGEFVSGGWNSCRDDGTVKRDQEGTEIDGQHDEGEAPTTWVDRAFLVAIFGLRRGGRDLFCGLLYAFGFA